MLLLLTMQEDISDAALASLVREEKDNEALSELINRHSGIYVDMVRRFGFKTLQTTEIGDILDEKDYNIYKAAIAYDEKRAKFSTYLAVKTKYICLTKRANKKKNKELVSYEDVDFLFANDDNNPDEFCLRNDYFSRIISMLTKHEDERVKTIFLERYFVGAFNKLKPWSEVALRAGVSGQACINIHNRTIKQLQKRIKNERIKL